MDDPNLRDASSALQKSGIHHFLAHGTLLGLIREGDFLPWDKEIDFALVDVADHERARIEGELIKIGFSLEAKGPQNTHFIRSGGCSVDLNFYTTMNNEITSGKSEHVIQIEWTVPHGPKVLVFIFSKLGALIHRLGTGTTPRNAFKRMLFFPLFRLKGVFLPPLQLAKRMVGIAVEEKPVRYRIPSHLSETRHHGLGNYSVLIPAHPEMVLEALYGESWRKPQRSSLWWAFTQS